MSHRSSLALVLLLAVTVPGGAAPIADPFTDLVTEMTSLQAALLAGTPDKTDKHEARALGKSINKLEKPATDLGPDLKRVVGVFKSLERTFPDEFQPQLTSSLDSLVGDLLGLLDSYVELEYGLLASDSSLPAGAERYRQKARDALDLVPTTQPASAAAQLLGKAHKFVTKGNAARGGNKTADVLTASVDGVPFTGTRIQLVYIGGGATVDIQSSMTDAAGFHSIELITNGAPITGPGEYAVQGVYGFGPDSGHATQHLDFNAHLVVTTLDIPGKHVVADFDFVTENDTPVFHVTGGHLDIHHIVVQ